jgi:hypothetical protein
MTLGAADRNTFAALIAEHVPINTLEEIALSDGAIADFDLAMKLETGSPDERRTSIARKVVAHYADRDQSHRLANLLWRKTSANLDLARQIVRFEMQANDNDAKEAALALRANMFQSRKLREFLADTEPKICAITSIIRAPGGNGLRLGTGFLVNPDLVLTAYHNVKDHITDGKLRPDSHNKLDAYFDFYDGNKIQWDVWPKKPALKVSFHPEWLVESSLDFRDDGILDELGESDAAARIKECLDFALVRLAIPVGQQSRSASGGTRRGWVDVASWKDDLQQDERIVIPQHPEGEPQSIDLGRYSDKLSSTDRSKTRLRYNTETRRGTSGAPCFTVFNTEFCAVGMHNATFKPHGKPIANQAVDIRRINERIATALQKVAVPLQPASTLWNAASDIESPQIILGRRGLLDWIFRAARDDATLERADRLYAAVGTGPNIGKSFSSAILRAARRGRTEPMVVFGSSREALPKTVTDFVRAVIDQLGIPQAGLNEMPSRPSDVTAQGAFEHDKLRKWASEDVPTWLDGVLARLKINGKARQKAAMEACDLLRQVNSPVPTELLSLANPPEPLPDIRPWEVAWIVIDGMSDSSFTSEVQDLVAGLTGGNLGEASMPQELRRLRWLFLGRVPDFVDRLQITHEALEPLSIRAAEIMAFVNEFLSSVQGELQPEALSLFEDGCDTWMDLAEFQQILNDPAKRLPTIQEYCQKLRYNVSKRMKSK